MVISYFSGCYGNLTSPLQYSVPVAVLYLCYWTVVEIVNSLFWLCTVHHFHYVLHTCVSSKSWFIFLFKCHPEIPILFLIYAQL